MVSSRKTTRGGVPGHEQSSLSPQEGSVASHNTREVSTMSTSTSAVPRSDGRFEEQLTSARTALPLLAGLSRRPEMREKAAFDALRRHQAGRIIAAWTKSIWRTKKKDTSQKMDVVKPVHQSVRRGNDLHWIFRALQSPSLRVRRGAIRILMDSVVTPLRQYQDHPTPSGSKRPRGKVFSPLGPRGRLPFSNDHFVLLTLLCDALVNVVQQELDLQLSGSTGSLTQGNQNGSSSSGMVASHFSSMSYGSGAATQPEGGDPVVQLVAVLSLVVCDFQPCSQLDSGRSNAFISPVVKTCAAKTAVVAPSSSSTSVDQGRNDFGTVGGTKLPRGGFPATSSGRATVGGIPCVCTTETFVAAGGLRWVTGNILRLVSSLIRSDRDSALGGTLSSSAPSRQSSLSDPPSPFTKIPGEVSGVAGITPSSWAPRSSTDPGLSTAFGATSKELAVELCQARIAVLVDLCLRSVMFASIQLPQSPDQPADNRETSDGNTSSFPSCKGGTKRQRGVETHRIGRVPSSGDSPTPSSSSTRTTPLSDPSFAAHVRKMRQETLERVHDVLWTSRIPAAYVGSGDGFPLSPLACLICANEVLRCTSGQPLPPKIRGMDRCMLALNRLVDPSGSVVVVTPTSPPPVSFERPQATASSNNSSSSAAKASSSSRSRRKRGVSMMSPFSGGASVANSPSSKRSRSRRRREESRTRGRGSHGDEVRRAIGASSMERGTTLEGSDILTHLRERGSVSSLLERIAEEEGRSDGRATGPSAATVAAIDRVQEIMAPSISALEAEAREEVGEERENDEDDNNGDEAMDTNVEEMVEVVDLEEFGGGDAGGEEEGRDEEDEDEDEEDDEMEDEEDEEEEEEDGVEGREEDEGDEEDADGEEGDGEMEERAEEEYEEVGNENLIVEENEHGVTVRVADEDEEDEAAGDDSRVREDSLDTDEQEEVDHIVRTHPDEDGAEHGQASDVVMVEMEQNGENAGVAATQPNVAAAEQSGGSTDPNTSHPSETSRPAGVAAPSAALHPTSSSASSSCRTSNNSSKRSNGLTVDDRRRAFLVASMEVMEAHYLQVRRQGRQEIMVRHSCGGLAFPKAAVSAPLLTAAAEHSLLQSICDIVKPPRKPPNLKIFLRRAPTQEEFFRGTLSRNPISLSTLRSRTRRPTAAATNEDGGDMAGDHEPTVRDLRQYIADNLQMSDSAEMLELLVSNKILDVNLKLRVVSQVLVRQHTMEGTSRSASGSSFLASFVGGSGAHLIASGSGLMVFGTNAGSARSSGRRAGQSMSLGSSVLLPLVVTYRLTGVDGEATEERVGESDLVDPEARPDTESSSSAYEERMEKEFGLTRSITDGNGIHVLLRSVRAHIHDILRRIRRDDVSASEARPGVRTYSSLARKNATKSKLVSSAVHPSLMLLRHCAQIADNRRKMVKARSPTLLLRMLLDVLNAIDDSRSAEGERDAEESDKTLDQIPQREGSTSMARNPTAATLQELIEILSSDIADEVGKDHARTEDLHIIDPAEGVLKGISEDDAEMDGEVGATLSLLLSSLRTTSLSPPFRKIISKLLPFLTYGRGDLSKELAVNFAQSISENVLCAGPGAAAGSGGDDLLAETLLDSALCLPPVSVCDGLRLELLENGFVRRVKDFIMREIPRQPPSWSPALMPQVAKGSISTDAEKARTSALREQWCSYFNRKGLKTAIEVLTSLSTKHAPTQSFLGDVALKSEVPKREDSSEESSPSLVQAFHWIESTSDSATYGISANGLGILTETLLDTISEDNDRVAEKIKTVRKKTRARKREIAEERRSKALVGMSSFGPLAGVGSMEAKDAPASSTNTTTTSSLFSLTGFAAALASTSQTVAAAVSAVTGPTVPSKSESEKASTTKPSWMEEMEAMEDEKGLTCAVCQEGRTLKPSEMLGLYAYVKKVSIPYNRCGGRGYIDGTMAFLSLPRTLPSSLVGSEMDKRLFQPALTTADELRSSPHAVAVMATTSATSSNSSRPTHYITTVTAGNAIHCSCHSTARSADRQHPKAPKGEWEGASLRNSRVTCNAILPLVSTKCSTVPLVAVESALADYQTTISNVLGSRPKSMLWTVLHDVRFLLLRMAYGEPLNADCGGGSLSSNSMLLFYQLFMADMFAKDAELDTPETARHAKNLPACFLAAFEILGAKDSEQDQERKERETLRVSVADGAPMAAICCVLFDFTQERSKHDDSPSSRQLLWPQARERFLRGLLRCAGRRKACGIIASGCVSSRASTAARLLRSESLADFLVDSSIEGDVPEMSASKRARIGDGSEGATLSTSLEAASQFLQPMLTLFITMDKLHSVLVSSSLSTRMDDEAVENGSQQLVDCLEACRKCATAEELVDIADKIVKLDRGSILDEYENGRQMAHTATGPATTS